MTDDPENGSKTGKWRMSPLAWRFLILLFVVALLVIDATRPPSPESWSWVWIGKKLWKMPGGIGAMIGAIIGFSALIYVTNKGYKNLIAAQDNQAKLDQKAELDRIEWEQQCLAAGLLGELRAVRINCEAHIEHLRDSAGYFSGLSGLAAGAGSNPDEYNFDVVPVSDRAFFKANVSNIGILGSDLAGQLTTIYEQMVMWQRDYPPDKKYNAAIMAKYLPKVAILIESTVEEMTDVIRRLEAIEQLLPDPGSSLETPENHKAED